MTAQAARARAGRLAGPAETFTRAAGQRWDSAPVENVPRDFPDFLEEVGRLHRYRHTYLSGFTMYSAGQKVLW